MEPISIKISSKLLAAIKEAAQREGRPYSNLMKMAVIKYIKAAYPDIDVDVTDV